MSISSKAAGFKPGVCTSTTRPSAPYEGQMIYETDTDRILVYNGSSWILQKSIGSYSTTNVTTYPNFLVYLSGGNGSAANGATLAYNTAQYDDTSSVSLSTGVFTVPANQAGVYQFVCNANCYNIGSSGYFRIQIVTTGSISATSQGSQTPAQSSTDVFSTASLLIKLAVSDTVYCRWVVPATGNYSAGLIYNNFSGCRIA
jgi:hypothetical protein